MTEQAWFDTIERPGGPTIAYCRSAAAPGVSLPGVTFLTGFRSDMAGGKAVHLESVCRTRGQAFLRFDYGGHGWSSGRFEDGVIGDWAEDAVFAVRSLTEGPQILVGSSMGGWMMLLVARRLIEIGEAGRIAGLIGIAAAPDFTQRLMWDQFPDAVKQALETKGRYEEPSQYSDEPLVITKALIDEGRDHLLLDAPLKIDKPVRLLQGMRDPDVPWRTALDLADALTSEDVEIALIKDGDHRLSEAHDLDRVTQTLDRLSLQVAGAAPPRTDRSGA